MDGSRTVDAYADDEIIVSEELTPFFVKQCAIGLNDEVWPHARWSLGQTQIGNLAEIRYAQYEWLAGEPQNIHPIEALIAVDLVQRLFDDVQPHFGGVGSVRCPAVAAIKVAEGCGMKRR